MQRGATCWVATPGTNRQQSVRIYVSSSLSQIIEVENYLRKKVSQQFNLQIVLPPKKYELF